VFKKKTTFRKLKSINEIMKKFPDFRLERDYVSSSGGCFFIPYYQCTKDEYWVGLIRDNHRIKLVGRQPNRKIYRTCGNIARLPTSHLMRRKAHTMALVFKHTVGKLAYKKEIKWNYIESTDHKLLESLLEIGIP